MTLVRCAQLVTTLCPANQLYLSFVWKNHLRCYRFKKNSFRFLKIATIKSASIFLKRKEKFPERKKNVHGTKYPEYNLNVSKLEEQNKVQYINKITTQKYKFINK